MTIFSTDTQNTFFGYTVGGSSDVGSQRQKSAKTSDVRIPNVAIERIRPSQKESFQGCPPQEPLTRNSNIKANVDVCHQSSEQESVMTETDFFKSIKLGDLTKVNQYLNAGCDLNALRKRGATPLHVAAYCGQTAIVELFLEKGAHIDSIMPCHGATALHYAAQNGHIDTVRALAARGANLNMPSKQGFTPLCLALLHGDMEVIKFLREMGGSFEKNLNDGNPLLHFAAENGNLKMIKFLGENHEDFNRVRPHDGMTALMLAAQKGHSDLVVHLLLKGADISKAKNNGCRAIHFAISQGHFEVVKILLNRGEDVNRQGIPSLELDNYPSPLCFAAFCGHINIVQLMLKYHPQVNANYGFNHSTALIGAAANGHFQIVKLLHMRGANLDKTDERGSTALHLAAENGHTEIVRYLVAKRAEINLIRSCDQMTPLHLAAQNGHFDITTIFLENGVKKMNKIWTPLHCAISQRHLYIVELLLGWNGATKRPMQDGSPFLHYAVERGDSELTKLLLKYKKYLFQNANVNGKRTTDGATPLQLAIQNGHVKIVRYLLLAGAKINVNILCGSTPLNCAIKINNTAIVKLLLEKGAKVNRKNVTAPLILAVQKKNVVIVKLLLEKGVDVNVRRSLDDATPLHFAANKGCFDIVSFLLASGANVNSSMKSGNTPLHFAAQNGYADIVELLIKCGAGVNLRSRDHDIHGTPLYFAAIRGHAGIVELLLKKGADVNATYGNDQDTLLHFASEKGDVKIVNFLLEHGADPNVRRGSDGLIPLYNAVSSRHYDVAKLLLKKGAHADIPYNRGWTPLHRAAFKGYIEMVGLLMANGADINLPNDNGSTALNKAALQGHGDVVELMLSFSAF